MTGGKHVFARPFLRIITRLLSHVDDNPARPVYQHNGVTLTNEVRIRYRKIKGLIRDMYIERLKDPCASDIMSSLDIVPYIYWSIN